MKVGVPRETKQSEHRVALVPDGVRQLVDDGHQVIVETHAGIGIAITDQEYEAAGAVIVDSPQGVFDGAELILKVKEPQEDEIALHQPHHTIFGFLHLAADKALTEQLLATGATYIAMETMQDDGGLLPLLTPMSVVAGRMAAQVGAQYLQQDHGGKGVLLGGVSGAPSGRVTVIGCGAAGTNAIEVAIGLGAHVTAIDVSAPRLEELAERFGECITVLQSTPDNILKAVVSSDVVIGTVLVPGSRAPVLVTRSMIAQMEPGSVVIDIAVDQGGCIETCHPTSHAEPSYVVDGVIHYCVSNIPGVVARTATYALTNVSFDYVRTIARLGVGESLRQHSILQKGLNIYKGNLVHQVIARDLKLTLEDFPHFSES
ncbi:alanine dehydrogenase [Rubellicoccus peritrichatus]|uniref:Alanine dehydrogenase n=1 Tax=Rubellicoccus peritrichatus TaxID=3080537 RepID=A0AAQ3LH93_9BACT|nr:alanine dehydrogenase [Puniceicoccus sp. CR14]WOO42094.1 alanine dehydrogenase [Puniceicoccus sp. CR14]